VTRKKVERGGDSPQLCAKGFVGRKRKWGVLERNQKLKALLICNIKIDEIIVSSI